MKIKIIGGILLLMITLVIYSCESDSSIEYKRYYSSGNLVYQNHCQNCHGANGEGLAALIPPLSDTTAIKYYKTKLPCILRDGLKGKISVAGKTFDGTMPSAGITPMEIAQVATYITNSFGNKMGVVTSDDVDTELQKCN